MKIQTSFRYFLMCMLSLLSWHSMYAQEMNVSGKVTDLDTGDPLPGVNILVQGTTQGTVTDIEGNYNMRVSSGATLVFSFIGYLAEEVAVEGRNTIDVILSPDIQSLQEVVVVGYGTQKKADLTGAVAVVDIEELNEQPTAQITNQLQGRVSGVTVLGSGQPGESPQVRIRGINTFGNNTPLYVVDGVPTQNINDINPNDIASMQVLKDAASASIYGSRAANGVIIITTKNGDGDVKVNYNAYYGTQRVKQGNVWNILSPQEMADLKWVATRNTNPGEPIDDPQYGSGTTPILPNYIAPEGAETVDESLYHVDPNYSDPAALNNFYRIVRANKAGTDWFHEIFKPAPITSHNLSVSGGGDQGSYLFSANYFDQQGTLINTYLKRYTLRANSQYNVSDHIRIGENLAFSSVDNPNIDILTEGSAIGMAFRQQPIIPVYDINGNYAGSFGAGLGNAKNPVAIQQRTRNNGGQGTRLFGNVYAEVDLMENFTIRSNFGGEIFSSNSHSFAFPEYENSENLTVNAYTENADNGFNWTWTNTLTYRKVFNDVHNLTLLAGTEAYENQGRSLSGTTQGYFSFDPNYTNLSTGSGTQINTSSRYGDALFSIFGRVDYSYNEKYLLGATIRRDGSSRFLNEQFGWFPAVSAGWRISEEGFMDGFTWIDDLKIRGGYGVMGNQLNVDPANAFTTYASNRFSSYYDITGSNQGITEGFQKVRIGNPDAKWEKNINANIGMDASLFSGRLQLTADYYRKDIVDLLYTPELSATAGQAEYPAVNIAQMKNAGIDLSANTFVNITEDLKLDATLTFTTYNNQIQKIAEGVPYFDQEARRFNGSSIVRNAVGRSVGEFFGYQIEGFWDSEDEIAQANTAAQEAANNDNAVYQSDVAVGRFRYADTNGDHQITPEDRVFLGNPNPDFSYGLNLGLTYRSFDFSMFLYGVQGNQIWNNVKWWTDFYSSFAGAKSHTALYDSWTPENHNATAPIQETNGSFSVANVPNSYFVEEGSYLRARNVQLGYTLPSSTLERVGIDRLRVYVQAVNLFTITGYSGIDPEITGGTTNFGIDEGAYPNQRQYLVGVNLSF